MDEARIQILIPTFNQIAELEATLDSIKSQEYNQENIYITVVDFGSTDGTYEKLLQYDQRNFGTYRLVVENENQRIAEAASLLSFIRSEGWYFFAVIVYPGEQLYPHCLKTLVTKYLHSTCQGIKMVVCESDVLTENGEVIHQKPLFEEDRIINGWEEMNEYIKRGYMHQVFHMGDNFVTTRYKTGSEQNERRFWNKLARGAQNHNVLYIKEVLACTKAVVYSDELKEILYRWEATTSMVRFYTSRFGYGFYDEFEKLAYHNLAEYALWRSFLLYQRGIHTKETEDCFLISSVIDETIAKKEIYQHMHDLIIKGECQELNWIRQYYVKENV